MAQNRTATDDGTIPLSELIESAKEQYDHIAEIHVAHLPTADEVSELLITLHSSEADSFEEYLDLVPHSTVSVNIGDSEAIRLPYTVIATNDGPGHLEGPQGTTVYTADTVFGAPARSIDQGLDKLGQKLNGVCPTCEEQITDFQQHRRESPDCLDKFYIIGNTAE